MAKREPLPGLDYSASAEQMVRLVLRSQLKAMCKLRVKALNWKDHEGVHDMRVCSRRLRSAMSDFRPYLRGAALPRLKLRTIADALGAVRDEDVALVALDDLKAQAKGRAAEGIQFIADEHRKRRKDVREKLKAAIKPSVIDDFRKEFQTKLKTLKTVSAKKSTARPIDEPIPFRDIAHEIVHTRIKELRDASHHLYFPFQIKELHELRILAKRLRYAVELFAGCWERHSDEIAKEISMLQTSLGELHDCDVWIDNLGKRLKQTAQKDKSDETTFQLRAGAAWLVKYFVKERTEHYREALTRWQEWQSNNFLEQLESILDSSTGVSPVNHAPDARATIKLSHYQKFTSR